MHVKYEYELQSINKTREIIKRIEKKKVLHIKNTMSKKTSYISFCYILPFPLIKTMTTVMLSQKLFNFCESFYNKNENSVVFKILRSEISDFF